MSDRTPPRGAAAAVLSEAKRLIVARGWTHGEFRSPDGRMCALEAIGAALPKPRKAWLFSAALCLLESEIGRRDPPNAAGSVVGWNDQPGQHLDSILEGFDRAVAASQQAETEPEP